MAMKHTNRLRVIAVTKAGVDMFSWSRNSPIPSAVPIRQESDAGPQPTYQTVINVAIKYVAPVIRDASIPLRLSLIRVAIATKTNAKP